MSFSFPMPKLIHERYSLIDFKQTFKRELCNFESVIEIHSYSQLHDWRRVAADGEQVAKDRTFQL